MLYNGKMEKFNSFIIRGKDDLSFAFCPKCQNSKSLFDFYVHGFRKDGATRYRPYCKQCRRVKERKNKARPVHSEILALGEQMCSSCKLHKPLSDFYSNGCFSDGTKKYRSKCKHCVLEFAKEQHPVNYSSKCKKRSLTPKNFISSILYHATQRKQHLGFNIDIFYLVDLYNKQQGKCAISGVEMTYISGSGRVLTNISIDRIDSSLGYIQGNVQFVCDVVNRMKSDLPIGQLYQWCSTILENHHAKVQESSLG